YGLQRLAMSGCTGASGWACLSWIDIVSLLLQQCSFRTGSKLTGVPISTRRDRTAESRLAPARRCGSRFRLLPPRHLLDRDRLRPPDPRHGSTLFRAPPGSTHDAPRAAVA